MKMLKSNICPVFFLKSFTFVILLTNSIIYLLILIFGGFEPDSLIFLATNLDFLVVNGENSPYFIKYNYEILRLFTSLFLTTGSFQFLVNNFLLLILGSNFEFVTDWKTVCKIYFFTGIGGEIFSNLLTDYPTVGNAGALLGLLGGFLSKVFYIGLTNEIIRARREILVLLVLVILILTMIIVMFPVFQGLNLIGGFVLGMVGGFAAVIGERERSIYRKYTKVFCLGIAVAFINTGLLAFYLARTPVFYELQG